MQYSHNITTTLLLAGPSARWIHGLAQLHPHVARGRQRDESMTRPRQATKEFHRRTALVVLGAQALLFLSDSRLVAASWRQQSPIPYVSPARAMCMHNQSLFSVTVCSPHHAGHTTSSDGRIMTMGRDDTRISTSIVWPVMTHAYLICACRA